MYFTLAYSVNIPCYLPPSSSIMDQCSLSSHRFAVAIQRTVDKECCLFCFFSFCSCHYYYYYDLAFFFLLLFTTIIVGIPLSKWKIPRRGRKRDNEVDEFSWRQSEKRALMFSFLYADDTTFPSLSFISFFFFFAYTLFSSFATFLVHGIIITVLRAPAHLHTNKGEDYMATTK